MRVLEIGVIQPKGVQLDKTRNQRICSSHSARQSEYTERKLEVNYCPGAISGKIFPRALILHKGV
ncbi:hypothetical protein GCM10023155_07680 [Bremerella cremea]